MRQTVNLADGRIATRYQIIGTNMFVADVWEPKAGHSTITTFDGAWFGQIGTRALPEELESMRCGELRYIAVKSWHAEQYEEAYRLILQAFPDMSAGRRDMGSISIW